MEQAEFEASLERPLASRADFVAAIARATEETAGFAAGKLGESERGWLRYPIVMERPPDPMRRRAYELVLCFQSLRAAGIFPADPGFLGHWSGVYAEHVGELDSIGLGRQAFAAELEILKYHHFTGTLIDAKDQQPDRSSPSEAAQCYLPCFRDRTILLICPFAELLRERATKSTFEAIWSKTGKEWFEPRRVDALEIPYGFLPETEARYETALGLFETIKTEIAKRDFDVALIAAGGLGDGLAGFVKRCGKIGISLGGHLQVLFGVSGERWRSKRTWQERYFNDSWVDLPDRYVPEGSVSSENYW